MFVLVALAFWHPIQRKCTAYLLLQSEGPSEEVLSEAVEQSSDPLALLARLWHTQKLPHRQFVMSYVNRVLSSKSDLFGKLEPLVFEGTADPDVEVRQLAFATLDRIKHPQLRPLALEQLSDADPAVRLIGFQALRSIATSNDVPIAIRFLSDPEPRVVVAAALVLRQVLDQDFGIKVTQAMPQFTCIITNPPPAPDVQAIQAGLQRWQEWWAAHHNQYQPYVPPPPSQDTPISLTTPNFKLPDYAGGTVQLAQFRGKSVLLVFWSPGAPASLDDVPALNALQERDSEHLVILGICIPAAPSCADEHEHGHGESGEHAHHNHSQNSDALQGADQFRAFARNAVERLKVSFPMLVDPTGNIGLRFKVEDRPTYVLIDAEGKIRRRFVGFRNRQALATIIDGPNGSGPKAAEFSIPDEVPLTTQIKKQN